MSKKVIYYLILLLVSIILLSGCMQKEITKEDILEKTKVQGKGIIEIKSKSGKKVKIKAVPDKNWQFVQWIGSFEGDENPQTIVVEENMNFIAQFEYIGPDITGIGTAEEPFIIYTIKGLEKIGEKGYSLDAYYKLGKNIDASCTRNENYNNGQGWQPIAKICNSTGRVKYFSGVFDGGNYEIRNLYINREDSFVGLFSYVKGGIIKNLNLVDVKSKGRFTVGGLVGDNDNGKIINSSVTGKISGLLRVGGLIGFNDGIIQNCKMQGNVIAQRKESEMKWLTGDYVGLLVGKNDKVIERSYAQGKVEGYSSVGGAVGINEGRIENVHATAKVVGEARVGGLLGYNKFLVKKTYFKGTVNNINGPGRVGGLIGHNEGDLVEVKDSYWKTKKVLQSDGGLGISHTQLKQKSTFENWDFNHIWAIDQEKGQPYLRMKSNYENRSDYNGPDITGRGTIKKPFMIYTFKGLEKIGTTGYSLDAWYELERDIDASPTQNKNYNNGQGWNPIGEIRDVSREDYKSFTGVFIGNDYEIRNLYINRPEENFVGLFRVLDDKSVIKLRLVNVDITGGSIVGGLTGFNGDDVNDISVIGKIKGKNKVGGICGDNGYLIEGSYFKGKVKGANLLGGLVGDNRSTIRYSHADSDIEGKNYIGGLAGNNESEIENSSAINRVKGESDIGGLVGHNVGTIEDTFAINTVIGDFDVGGLVGSNLNTIRTSYTLGVINGEVESGGLVGYNEGTINNSYTAVILEGTELLGGLVGSHCGEINFCYSNSNVKGDHLVGGLVGYNLNGKVQDSYWNSDLVIGSYGGTGKDSEELKQKSTFENWDFEKIWYMEEEKSSPCLK